MNILFLSEDDRIVFAECYGEIVSVSKGGHEGLVYFDRLLDNSVSHGVFNAETNGRTTLMQENNGELPRGTRVRIDRIRIIGSMAFVLSMSQFEAGK